MMKSPNDMTRRPKSIQSHYRDSFIINSNNLKSFLINNSVSCVELDNIVNLLSQCYNQKVDVILEVCDGDNWTKLESFSSPLILFICCIDKIVVSKEIILSHKSKHVLQSFSRSLESWMIW
jgi:hypothetical protein